MATKPDIMAGREYASFRSSVSFRTEETVYRGREYTFKFYETGPKHISCPLVFLPPVCGTADIFFKQLLPLGAQGIRCIAIEYPVAWTLHEFAGALDTFFSKRRIEKVHLCGASLGGFLAQKYTEYTAKRHRVVSLVLINAFTETSIFKTIPSPAVLKFLPGFALRRLVLSSLPTDCADEDIAQSLDFVSDCITRIPRDHLAARLVLNVADSYVEPQKVSRQGIDITIIFTADQTALSAETVNEMTKYYPEARLAEMKSGGNFPYVSRADEINLYLKIHVLKTAGTRYSAIDPASPLIMADKEAGEDGQA